MLLRIANAFSTAPGPRRTIEGKFSGEQFRTELLSPMVRRALAENAVVEVDLDGTSGYGTSFLEESFGGLIRNDGFTLDTLRRVLTFKSEEEPELLNEIHEYMDDAERERLRC